MLLREADLEAYRRDGVACLRGGCHPDWVERLRAATEEALASPGLYAEAYGPDGRFRGDLDVWQRIKGFRDFVFESPAAEIAGILMEANSVRLFYDQLLVKEPSAADRTPWHQDQPYWAVKGRQICSVWLALDPVESASGLEFVRKSHLWTEHNPKHFSDESPYANTGLPPLPDIEAHRSDYDILNFDMEPGDCLVFQAMIVHGAAGNRSSDHRRRAYSTRWIGDDARFCKRPGEVAIPTFETRLEEGDPFDGDTFPLVWKVR